MTRTTPVRPKVSDPALQTAIDEAGPNIENYYTNLDGVSADIKSVEQYLTSSGIRIPAEVHLPGKGIELEGEIDVLENYSGRIWQDEEAIQWTADPKNIDRWRLLWTKRRKWGELELCERVAIAGPTFNGPVEPLEDKPLLETPVDVRLRAHKQLGELIRVVSKSVEIQPHETSWAESDDIPF
ncbi:MAG TPA: hypothetical protein VG538_05745 [Vicinamibacterales bacterium]|jgi:hypothetical protein|nr:hypothetical protein [Vicinamibacterales bacterium]